MKPSFYSFFILAALFLASCGGNGSRNNGSVEGDTLTSRAGLLTLVDRGDYVAAVVADPWNPGKQLAAYALVPRDADTHPDVPDGFQIVETPVRRSVIYSSTNTAAIAELGVLDAVAAVAEGNYYVPSDTVARLIASGRIADIGSSMAPKLETLIEVSPDVILSSPYENAGHGVLDALKVAVIECADYMETTPLGRSEWILLLGYLYGKPDEAAAVYNDVVADYLSLADAVTASGEPQPKVLTEMLTSGVWYVPGGKSYMAHMLADAGAAYPWSDNASSGSLQFDAAAVIDKASDADIWILRNYGPTTLTALGAMSPLYKGIKAFADGEVYSCDTSTSTIFNDIAFHPERILADFVTIFHPSLMPDRRTVYYLKTNPE